MPERSEQQIPAARLDDAVARGLITAEQREAILALRAPEPPVAAEARSGLNAVMIAYNLGAAAVVFAFGWFVVDRWEALGPGGVLVVAFVYAAIFAGAARFVGRLGFREAASLLVLLAVCMTPLAAWALLDLAGLWYEPVARAYPYNVGVDVLEVVRWMPLELATALAALVALRRVHYGVLVFPAVAVVPALFGQVLPLVLDPELSAAMTSRAILVAAAVLLAAGYWVDRHPRDDQDYAQWMYLMGLLALTAGVAVSWGTAGYLRHGLPMLAVALFALSLFLRRAMFLVFGVIGFIVYLAYLAFDVFRQTLSFPIVLATFGVSVIVVTVWLQRRYPALARRVEAHQAGRRTVPHAALVFGGGIAVALTLFAFYLPDARYELTENWARARHTAVEAHRRQRRRPAPTTKPLQTVPPPASRPR